MTIELGAVKNGGTPGVLVQLVASYVGYDTRIAVQKILIQPLPANAGIVYIGKLGMVRATYANVSLVIPKPASSSTGPFGPTTLELPFGMASLNASEYYLDADSGGDGALITLISL